MRSFGDFFKPIHKGYYFVLHNKQKWHGLTMKTIAIFFVTFSSVVCLLTLFHAVYSILIGDKYYYHGSHKKRHVMGEVLTAFIALTGFGTGMLYLIGLQFKNTHLLQPYIYFLWSLIIIMFIILCVIFHGKIHFLFVAVAEFAGVIIIVVVLYYSAIALMKTFHVLVHIPTPTKINSTSPLRISS